MQLETPFVAALNHLLRSEPWARERLAPFAGDAVELRAPPFPALMLVIAADGLLRPGARAGAPALTISVKPGMPAALLRGEDHVLRALEISGNAQLAEAVGVLARHLRWDFEEDLSRAVGDVAAHRIAGMLRELAAWQRDAAERLMGSAAAYATEEAGLLASRRDLDTLAGDVARLRDAIERLDARVRRRG